MSGAIITLENVSWAYSPAGNSPSAEGMALNNISLSIEEGECVAVMGENGAGKTSLCRLLNGLIPHSLPGKLSGAVRVDGILTASATVPQLAQKVGTVFEDPPTQLFTVRVYDEVAFALENLLLPPGEIREKVSWALDAAGLSAYADYAPSALSGGQQQRLAIAAALAMASKILVLDEPTSQLDPAGAHETLSLIRDLCTRKGLTAVMATNCGEEGAEIADKICVLKNGSLAAYDTPQNIFNNEELRLHKNLTRRHEGTKITKGNEGLRNHSLNLISFSVPRTEGSMCLGERSFGNSSVPAITINNVSYQYSPDSLILKDINLAIGENEFTVITGPNGCGKTTLLKNISGLLRPLRGTILLRGKDTADMDVSEIAGELGFVMQNPDRQLFTSTVYDEVAFGLKHSPAENKLHDKVEEALSMVNLWDKRDVFPPALNRADRVKTVFAAILAMGPRIIMLDEPFAGQDIKGCRLITDIALKLHQQGYTIIIVTHNLGVIAEYAPRIIALGSGN